MDSKEAFLALVAEGQAVAKTSLRAFDAADTASSSTPSSLALRHPSRFQESGVPKEV